MKSLVLKDLYTVLHNSKAFLVVIIGMSFFLSFTTNGDTGFYNIFCAIMSSMLVVTTFSFDHLSNWEPYAMILPITRKDVVRGKFALLFLVCAAGTVLGFVLGLLSCTLLPSLTLDLREQVFYLFPAFSISLFMGSLSIPLIFKFGAEKARVLLMAAFCIPSVLLILALKTAENFGVHLSEQTFITILVFSPLLVLVFAFFMYQISCRVFEKKEL